MNKFTIDDITWNDLSMEQVYEKINTAQSSVGAEYLKSILRTTRMEENVLSARSKRAAFFSEHPKTREGFRRIFKDLGKTKKISLYDYIFRFHEVKPSGNAIHYLLALLLLASIVMIFVQPVIGIISMVVMFVLNISTYFRYKAEIESFFMCFKYIVRMLQAAARICRYPLPDEHPLEPLLSDLRRDLTELSPMKRGSWLLTNSVSGSLVDVVMDYIRMLFHVDIIKFNQLRKLAEDKTKTIDQLFCTLGELESDLCISFYRESLDSWCEPSFSGLHSGSALHLSIRGMYHPLTAAIVKNDLETGRSILLTGSNASGKSTFLKQMAINQIFAQTICTCLADSFATGFCRVISSMALSDNLLGNESYFIVEIKSLKRILDAMQQTEEAPVLCFIDEVLRGTNTKERVAASSQILRKMAGGDALCFAATHDIELTSLLTDVMDNYHFEETVREGDVIFDYQLKKGPATTRNAIKLMQIYGFAPEIIIAANQLVDQL